MIKLTQKISASASFTFSVAATGRPKWKGAWPGTAVPHFARELHVSFPCSLLTCGCQWCLHGDLMNWRVVWSMAWLTASRPRWMSSWQGKWGCSCCNWDLLSAPLYVSPRGAGEGRTIFRGDGVPHRSSQQHPGNQNQLPCWGTRSISETSLTPPAQKAN